MAERADEWTSVLAYSIKSTGASVQESRGCFLLGETWTLVRDKTARSIPEPAEHLVHWFASISVGNLLPNNQALQSQSGIVGAAAPKTWWNLSLMNTGKPQCADLVYAFYPIYCLWLNGALPHAPSPFFISLLQRQTLNLLMVMEKKN